MIELGLLAVPFALGLAFQDPKPGIGRELAEARSELISEVQYRLQFELEPGMEEVSGHLYMIFTLAENAQNVVSDPLVLDFAGNEISEVEVNGIFLPHPPTRVHDHLVLAPTDLNTGINTFTARFKSKVASTGTPLTRYRDPRDGREYLYTLLVPADAHYLFPCFDQPDLKASFQLRLTVPRGWVAVANGDETNDPARVDDPEPPRLREDGRLEYAFAATEPFSTYLFAFAAGPFAVVKSRRRSGVGDDPQRPIRLFVRPAEQSKVQHELIFDRHIDALKWLSEYFDISYPFGKLDLVLLPGFPYGGMEHVGAIFYRESAMVFDHEPTDGELIRRSTLLYHEVSHQWFGNFVTMEWFDDLWLKEGFATFVGFSVLEALEPDVNAWLRFHQRVKPRAYAIDVTSGTTPIYQELANLADAKSAYGAIVYNKAPAVLRELEARLGRRGFRAGVRRFLKEHPYGNATWQDLVEAFRQAAGMTESYWSDRWILTPGMPTVRAEWSVDDAGDIERFTVTQTAPAGGEGTWPITIDMLLVSASGERQTLTVPLDDSVAEVEELVGARGPACVLLNPRDVAYGLFLPDQRSLEFLFSHLPELDDRLLRAVALSFVFNSVREGEFVPSRYADLALRMLEDERDPETHDWLLDTLGTTVRRYLDDDAARSYTARSAELLIGHLKEGRAGLQLQTFRFLARSCATTEVLELCRGLLTGERELPGLVLGQRDRFLACASLLAAGDPAPLEAEKLRAAGEDVGKEVYLAEAAAADAEVKKRYFQSYLNVDEPPEQWMQDSLQFFHWPGQGELTLPYLRAALEQVRWVKKNRKVFFMPAWIDAFINGHSSARALEIVQGFLAENSDLPGDIRRKVEQSLDGLARAVRVR